MPSPSRRMRLRRLRLVALIMAVVAVPLLVSPSGHRRTAHPAAHPSVAHSARPVVASPSPSHRPAAEEPVPATFPHAGPGTWRYSGTAGPVRGTGGPLRRYRVAVESDVPYDVDDFAGKVDAALGDPRGWTASGRIRLQRVPGDAPAEFTVYLATALTSARMCLVGGLHTDGYTSCRLPGQVIINLDRWFEAVPEFIREGVPLDVYRTYAINHETGHQLGYGHELCPGAGRPAPVMEQQTLGLHGCTANPWPYVGGERYVGPPGQY